MQRVAVQYTYSIALSQNVIQIARIFGVNEFGIPSLVKLYALQTEDDLRKLLTTIANNKFLEFSRHQSAAKRDRSITESWSGRHDFATSHKDDPAEGIMFSEMQLHLAQRLSPHELELLQLRRAGKDWAEIAEQLQEEQTVLRKRYSRALNRVANELGLMWTKMIGPTLLWSFVTAGA